MSISKRWVVCKRSWQCCENAIAGAHIEVKVSPKDREGVFNLAIAGTMNLMDGPHKSVLRADLAGTAVE
ncbi:MAG: hypothetical protein EBY45_01855 [Gammaproteobacteria bacterium]|nr:hypothetical protein [Gammaproteobacteria bacterium]